MRLLAAPLIRWGSVVRGMPSESARYGVGVSWARLSRNSLNARVMASSSRWLEPWMSQYSSWAFRFHQVLGQGVGSSQGPLVAITGASRRAAEAVLYSCIQ